jgi:hypothetical protein
MLMRITEHYIILGGVAFLNDHAATLQTVLVNLIGAVSPRGEAYVSLVTEALLRQFPAEGGLLLLQCGVIKKFLNACSLASSGSTESQPDRVLVLYLTTMARVLIASPEMLATPGLFSPGEAFGLDQLVSLLDAVSSNHHFLGSKHSTQSLCLYTYFFRSLFTSRDSNWQGTVHMASYSRSCGHCSYCHSILPRMLHCALLSC